MAARVQFTLKIRLGATKTKSKNLEIAWIQNKAHLRKLRTSPVLVGFFDILIAYKNSLLFKYPMAYGI